MGRTGVQQAKYYFTFLLLVSSTEPASELNDLENGRKSSFGATVTYLDVISIGEKGRGHNHADSCAW